MSDVPVGPAPTDPWDRLLAALDGWGGSATEVAPGQVEVALPDAGRRVVLVLTPEEWDEMWGTGWGSVDDAIAGVQQTLLRLGPDEGFAVYRDSGLEPSTEPTLAEEDETSPGPGEWVVLDTDRQVTSRFSDDEAP